MLCPVIGFHLIQRNGYLLVLLITEVEIVQAYRVPNTSSSVISTSNYLIFIVVSEGRWRVFRILMNAKEVLACTGKFNALIIR